MKHGVVLPGGTAMEQVELAVLAERSGWDGVFSYETAYGVDPWTMLAAMAVRTERVRFGTVITPLPWRRPWKLASQVATLDQVSGGRAILGAGVGAVDDGLPRGNEETGLRERAEMMDEGIDLIRMLWEGGNSFHGKHYSYDAPQDFAAAARPVQKRLPIWVIGVWPRMKSMRRVLKCDGVIPQFGSDRPTPGQVREMRAWLTEQGSTADIAIDGESPATREARDVTEPWAEAGATWWLETRWTAEGDDKLAGIRARIEAGPADS